MRLLQINRSVAEAEQIVALLAAGGIQVDSHRVATAGELAAALAGQAWPVMVADQSTLQSALAERPAGAEAPGQGSLLVVVGDQAEAGALIAMMRAGARDFVRRQDLLRLPSMVARLLEEATARALREESAAVTIPREGELRLRRAIDAGAMGVWDWDLRSEHVHWTEQLCRLFGLKPEEFDGRNESFVSRVHPEDRPGLEAAIASARDQRLPHKHEFRINWPDGTIHWLSSRGLFFYDEAGKPVRMVGIVIDVTERRGLEDLLRQAQKMEAMGQLAGGVAHDYNNILTSTLMHLELLLHEPGLPPQVQNSLHELEEEARRAVSLTRQLLMFSRRQIIQVKPVDLNEVLRNLLKMLRRVLGEQIRLEFRSDGCRRWIEADTGMVEQVVMNLCVNSRDAMMPAGGPLTIDTRLVELGPDAALVNPNARAGRFACLSVTDAGCGIDAAVMDRIFEPFFTTKAAGQGTGLGLATVYAIAKQHLGWVEVSSQVGKGTTFRVYFPEFAAAAAIMPETLNPQQLRGHETILVVEDEPAVRRMAVIGLQWFGYQVIEAANGPEAIGQWSRHHAEIDLLLTDMVMPEGMTGLDLAGRLREMRADLKVIISSGYSTEITKSGVPAGPGIAYLAKPYEVKVLVAAVRKCLDRA
jgi:PAS domain S-box-containing protein